MQKRLSSAFTVTPHSLQQGGLEYVKQKDTSAKLFPSSQTLLVFVWKAHYMKCQNAVLCPQYVLPWLSPPYPKEAVSAIRLTPAMEKLGLSEPALIFIP